MADELGFDLNLGSDPFGGGSEGLTQFSSGAGQSFQPSFPAGLSLARGEDPGMPRGQDPGAPRGGFMDFAKGLFARGEDPGAPRQPGGSGGVLDTFGSFAKSVLPVAQLGVAGLGVKSSLDAASNARRQSGALAQGQQIQRESAQPLQQFGSNQLQQAQAGHVDPAVQAMIDQWLQGEKVKIQQFFAHNNISDSTMLQSALADLEGKAVSMRASVLGQDKNQAIAALQAAMQGGGQISQTASQEQNELDALIGASNKALAAMMGGAG